MKFFFLTFLGVFFFSICFFQEIQSQEKQKQKQKQEVKDSSTEIFAVPLNLEGFGIILGVGFQYKAQAQQEFIIGGGIAEREQKGYGAVAKISLSKNIFFSGVLLKAEGLKIPSTYTRGSEEASLFYSKSSLSGSILGGGYNFEIFPKNQFNLTFSLGSIEQQFHGFLDENFQEIQTEGNLGNLNSTLTNYGLTYNFQQYPEKILTERGWRLYSKIASSTQTTNTLYSGTTKTDFTLNLHIPLFRSLYMVPKFFQSTVVVIEEQESSPDSLRTHFKICDPNCELEDKLVENLSQHNKYGTATPLGGAEFIRSDPFFRYKGAKTEYTALEIRYPFYLLQILMEPIFFVEKGRSYDPQIREDGERDFILVKGIEYRFHISKELTYKIIYAQSNRNKIAFQLAVGSTW